MGAAIPIETVVEHVAFEVNLTAAELTGDRRPQWVSEARSAIAWLATEVAGLQLTTVAAALAQHRQTAGRSLRRAHMLRLIDADFRALTDQVAELLLATVANDL